MNPASSSSLQTGTGSAEGKFKVDQHDTGQKICRHVDNESKQTQSDWEWKDFSALFKEIFVLSLSGVFLQQLCNYCLSQNSMEVYNTSKAFSVVSKGRFDKNCNVNCFSLTDF